MKLNANLLWGIAIATVMFNSCDEKYDLSDVDTNVTVNVEDLIVPVNLDDITLKSIIDLGEDDIIKIVNGEYAVVKKGNFHSDKVSINSFTIKKPSIEPISESIQVVSTVDQSKLNNGSVPKDLMLINFDIASADASTDISLQANDVDESIVSIDTIGMQATLTAKLAFSGLENFAKDFYVENLVLTLPKYLNATVSDGGKYDMVTGRVTFANKMLCDALSGKTITITIKDLYADKAGATFVNHTFSHQASCKAEGIVAVYGENLKQGANVSALLKLQRIRYQYELGFDKDIDVSSFYGNVDYTVKGLNVDPIMLDSLPDVLNQPGTQIGLGNPQIYVQLNNPLYNSQVYPKAEMTLVPDPVTSENFAMSFTAQHANNLYCMSPMKPDSYFSDEESNFAQAQYLEFSNLGRLLYGERIPTSITLNVNSFARQHVSSFTLGDYDAVEGEYVFFAPLQLTEDSHIAYADTVDGWNDEDVDAITIKRISLSAQVEKDIPYSLTLEIWPIDKSGNKISDVKGVATLASAIGEKLPLEVQMEGEVTHLDGIIIKAKVDASPDKVLAPDMSLKVTDLRVKVTGYYEKEL